MGLDILIFNVKRKAVTINSFFDYLMKKSKYRLLDFLVNCI